MSFLAHVNTSKFAAKLCAVAGFNLTDALDKGDENALKAFIDFKSTPSAEHANALSEVVSENEKLSADLDAAKASVKSLFDAKAALEASYKADVATAAAALVASQGHKPVSEVIPVDPKSPKKIDEKLTGMDRVRAVFSKQTFPVAK